MLQRIRFGLLPEVHISCFYFTCFRSQKFLRKNNNNARITSTSFTKFVIVPLLTYKTFLQYMVLALKVLDNVTLAFEMIKFFFFTIFNQNVEMTVTFSIPSEKFHAILDEKFAWGFVHHLNGFRQHVKYLLIQNVLKIICLELIKIYTSNSLT